MFSRFLVTSQVVERGEHLCQLNVSQLNARIEHPLTMGESKSGDSQYVPGGDVAVRGI